LDDNAFNWAALACVAVVAVVVVVFLLVHANLTWCCLSNVGIRKDNDVELVYCETARNSTRPDTYIKCPHE
jgi:uncharacterized membrane protein YjgN (DUF898 family)